MPLESAIPHELVREFVGAAHGEFDRVKELLGQEPALVQAAWDRNGGDWETPLGAATHTGNKDIALYLLEHGARMDIFAAAMLGRIDVVSAILKAQPEALMAPGPHGISLIQHAEKGGEEAAAVTSHLKKLIEARRRALAPSEPKAVIRGKLRAFLERMQETVEHLQVWFLPWAAVVLMGAVMYVGSRGVMEVATRIHWLLGLAAACLYAFIVYVLIRHLFRSIKERESAPMILGVFLMAVLTAMSVCAWLSFALHTFLDAPYKSARDLTSTTAFCDLYGWVLIDMIPGANVWTTIHVPRPIESLSALAAMPELLFRLLVVVPLIAAVKMWNDSR